MKNKIAIVMGSQSDWEVMQHASQILKQFHIEPHVEIVSAHRTPDKLFEFAEHAYEQGFQAIIAGAGGSAHLPGMLASKTTVPILGVPIEATSLQGLDALLSIVQMPKGIPVATFAIGKAGAINAALFAIAMLATHDQKLHQQLQKYRLQQTQEVLDNPFPK